MKSFESIADLKGQLDVYALLGREDAKTFLAEMAYTNFSRGRVMVLAILAIFLGLLLLDILRFYTGTWSVSPGYHLLFWSHCAIIGVLAAALMLIQLKPAKHSYEIKCFHHMLVDATIFLILLNMIPISIGDILINGSMVAYLGALFTIAAVIVMTNRFSIVLYLGNMAVMLAALRVVATEFGIALEIQAINLVAFTLIAFLLSRVVFFYNIKNFQNQQLIDKQQRELEELATKDPLTNTLNRRRFTEIFNIEIARSQRYRRPFALILFDLDHFKRVNDDYGHNAGDVVLTEVARLVRHNLRKTDIFARWGGEEFIVVSPETDLDGMTVVAEKLRRVIEAHQPLNAPAVTASFGVTQYASGEDLQTLIQRADEALYCAKEKGRNCIEAVADPKPQRPEP
jgi:diguanylate cyclase (GGDEF)-like protein